MIGGGGGLGLSDDDTVLLGTMCTVRVCGGLICLPELV